MKKTLSRSKRQTWIESSTGKGTKGDIQVIAQDRPGHGHRDPEGI